MRCAEGGEALKKGGRGVWSMPGRSTILHPTQACEGLYSGENSEGPEMTATIIMQTYGLLHLRGAFVGTFTVC